MIRFKIVSIIILTLGLVLTPGQNSSAGRKGFLVYSKGANKGRTLYKKAFSLENGKAVMAGSEQKICEKGAKGGDIQSVISHDGKWVAFARSIGGSGMFGADDYHGFGNWDIYVVRIDGGLPAEPVKVHHGYWPSWGDDSHKPTKTLYFSFYPKKAIYKCIIGPDGTPSEIKEHHSGFTNEGDLHMQGSPDGKKIAYRQGGTVYVLNIETGKKAGLGGGCHPSWCANSEWIIHASSQVARHDGKHHKKGIGGNYHYGSSANMKWFATRTGSNTYKDQNSGKESKLYTLEASDTDFKISSPVVFAPDASWMDVHEIISTSEPVNPDPPAQNSNTSGGTPVKVSEVVLDKINTFKVETEMGVFHWEKDDGKSGWMSAFDKNGKDWIQAGPKGRGVGINSQYRGLPNSGADDWGHPSRSWGHKKTNVKNAIIGPKEGKKIVIESGGNNILVRWHCFNTHITMEVVELKKGKYHFLWEGTPGGTIHTKEGVITADGKTRPIKEGWFAETPDWPAGKNGEWLVITDPNKKHSMWMAQSPATNDKGELWYQGGNMDLASFGRPDNKPTLTNTQLKFVWGFVPYEWDFKTTSEHIEKILENPIQEKKVTVPPQAHTPGQNSKPVITYGNRAVEISFLNTNITSSQLYDVSGRLVGTWDSAGGPFLRIPGLTKGVYILKSQIGPGKSAVQKIILGL